jgi:hypothetical protein
LSIAARDAYYTDVKRLERQFQADLEAEYEIGYLSQNIRDRVFGKAWDMGHSGGFSEIASYYIELMDVVKLFK